MNNFEDKMDAYIHDQMNELERKLFEKELAEDPAKQEQFEHHKEAIQLVRIASLKNQLDELESRHHSDQSDIEEKKSKVISLFSRPQLIGIAASLVILIAAALWIFLPKPQSPAQFAFDKYYQKDPGLPTTMGVSEQITLDQAMLYYKQNEYSEARNAFSTLLDENPSDTARYYYAMTLIELDELSEAEKVLRKSEIKEGNYSQRRDWYLSMVLLEQEKKEEALDVLRTIAQADRHVYKNEAAKVIDDLTD